MDISILLSRMATSKKSPQKSSVACKRLKTLENDVASIVSHAMLTESIKSDLNPFNYINKNSTVL